MSTQRRRQLLQLHWDGGRRLNESGLTALHIAAYLLEDEALEATPRGHEEIGRLTERQYVYVYTYT